MEKAPHNTGEDTPPESQELNQFEKKAQKVGEFGSATKERSKNDTERTLRSFYESDNIPQNQNGNLILDPNAILLPTEGYLGHVIEDKIITTPEDAAFLSSSEKIDLSKNNKISAELLRRCLSVDSYYLIASRHMHEDNPNGGILQALRLYYNSEDDIRNDRVDIGGGASIPSMSDLVRGLNQLEENGALGELHDTEKQRLAEFREITSPQSFVEKIRGTIYETQIDGKKCILPVDNIVRFLSLSPENLKDICITDPDGKIGQLSKTEFAYAASEYLKKNKITENYVFSDNIERRINSLTSGQYIDFSAVNKLLETEDTLYEKVE